MRMAALLVADHDTIEDEDDVSDAWQPGDGGALLTYVEDLDATVLAEWQRRAPHIRRAASRTAGIAYFANVCTCGALQGDWFLTQPGDPFFPQTAEAAHAIAVEWIEAPLRARAGTSESLWIDDRIARAPYPGWQPRPPARVRRRRLAR